MLSVGDHDFDTPSETVEACVAAVRGGHHHYTQLPGIPGAARGDGQDLDAGDRRRHHRRQCDRHAGRPVGALRRRARRARPRRPRGRGGALLRHLPRHVPRRRRRFHRRRSCCRRRLPAARRGDRESADAEDQGDPPQHAEQPDRCGLFACRARRHRRALPPPRSLAPVRRGLLDAGRRRACLAARAGRHGGAHAGHQLAVEEPRHDRLAHRLADRPGRLHHADGQPQPRLHLRAQRLRQPRRDRCTGQRLRRRADRRALRQAGARSSSTRCAA